MELDHLAVCCARLDEGVAWVEATLGVTLQPGGQHARFGTHNRLLELGEGLYLEVIAPDPGAPVPLHPRWFGLDHAGAPRLGNWIARVEDLETALRDAPDGAGDALALSRGDLAWRIAVPPDGSLPYGGAYPTLIAWESGLHPSRRLPDAGVRLTALTVQHPEAVEVQGMLGALHDPRVSYHEGPLQLRAVFQTPTGEKVLQ